MGRKPHSLKRYNCSSKLPYLLRLHPLGHYIRARSSRREPYPLLDLLNKLINLLCCSFYANVGPCRRLPVNVTLNVVNAAKGQSTYESTMWIPPFFFDGTCYAHRTDSTK